MRRAVAEVFEMMKRAGWIDTGSPMDPRLSDDGFRISQLFMSRDSGEASFQSVIRNIGTYLHRGPSEDVPDGGEVVWGAPDFQGRIDSDGFIDIPFIYKVDGMKTDGTLSLDWKSRFDCIGNRSVSLTYKLKMG